MDMTRREFTGGLTLAGAAGLVGVRPETSSAEPPPETTRIRLVLDPSICLAPLLVAEELLRGEGFTEVRYVPIEGGLGDSQMVGAGKADLGMDAAPAVLMGLDRGDPIVILAGIHVGCYELFAIERIRSVSDLKGKTVAISQLRDDRHAFVASMMTHVGLDPRKDVRWVTHPADEAMKLLAAGKVDAFLGFPPEPQQLRAQRVGHVIVNIRTDRPWSQYFCCLAFANREFVRRYPLATKRALRAILKANAICAEDPDRVTRFLVGKGYTTQAEYTRQALTEIPYAAWQDYNAQDTVRFYALRFNESGFIKSSPQKILAQGTDWRFLNELKKELKG